MCPKLSETLAQRGTLMPDSTNVGSGATLIPTTLALPLRAVLNAEPKTGMVSVRSTLINASRMPS
jgi:hypothetical protein